MNTLQDSAHAVERALLEGQTALDAGAHRDAAAHFGAAFALAPTTFALAEMAAQAWRLAGDLLAERAVWLAANRTARPTDARTLFALGTGLLETGAPFEALPCFEAVVRMLPRDPAALGALASAHRATGDPQRGWALAQKAVELAPTAPALLLTAAQIRHALGDLTGARKWLEKAEQVRPGHAGTTVQRAFTLLIGGANAAGWEAWEARGLPAGPIGARNWSGEALNGSTIAVVMEQGIGDLFHFVRYVRRLEARGPQRVVVECPAPAVALLEQSGFDAVPTGQLPPVDWYVPLLSLPHRLASDSDVANDGVPYLSTGTPRTAHTPPPSAAASPTPARRPRVGIVWKGNAAFLSTALRDLDDSALNHLGAMPEVQWVSLQMGEPVPAALAGAEQPAVSGDWLATAQLLESLDAVVSVDTAVAHLAGALGVPVYVLLPYAPDWRWGLRSERTVWYPSARLLRQPKPRDWPGAIATLRKALTTL
jgi:tetratricopeptide (TPR) repeat protein